MWVLLSHLNSKSKISTHKGCVPLEWSGSGSMIASKEPMNPCPEWIHRFLQCTMIRVILDHGSWSGSPQTNVPLVHGRHTCVTVFVFKSITRMAWLLVSATYKNCPSGLTHRPPGSSNCTLPPSDDSPGLPVPRNVSQVFFKGSITLIWGNNQFSKV